MYNLLSLFETLSNESFDRTDDFELILEWLSEAVHRFVTGPVKSKSS